MTAARAWPETLPRTPTLRMAPSLPTRRRLAGLLAVLGILLGILGEGAHLALESHRWCELHGAMEHGSEPAAAPATLSLAGHAVHVHDAGSQVADAEEGTEGFVLEALPDAGPEAHELCRLLLAVRPTPAIPGPATVRAPAPELVVALDAAWGARPFESVARLRLAPKQSPPVG